MAAKNTSITPKGTITLKNVGAGFGKDSLAAAGLATLKWKRGSLNTSLALSDQTCKNVTSLKDVVATLDYKVPKIKGVTLNTKYELGTKKYQAGATWDGKVVGKATTLKAWHSNKDNKVSGESTLSLSKSQKANVTFNQSKVLTAKYTLTKGDFTYEPSYNFDKKAPAVSVAKKQGKNNLKLSYDIKSENASLEWARKPLKITISSVVPKKLGSVGKPTVAAVFENVYEF